MKYFYLVIDTNILCCYLASKWIENFDGLPNFKGILVREDKPSDEILQQRKEFHAKYAESKLNDEISREFLSLYPDFDEIVESAIRLFGIPKYSITDYHQTIFLGRNLNGESAKNWLKETCKNSQPYFFSYQEQILKTWWIEISQRQIINCHPAVLPYARGIYPLENIAILKDIDKFREAAGVTIHYIDEGVDTGPIIRAEKIIDPFQFNSIWELKAYLYVTGNNVYVKTAKEILSDQDMVPAGVVPNPQLTSRNFLSKDFTPEKRELAEAAYLSMKNYVCREKTQSSSI
ncbi:formyltransferase family protein [Plectonema radiosum NIES-515]|uniref:phosphoribosylglycinamide formyltransferase 1 n=1 Tax=Plectonema radiosum NIES-515 TaxID=2986073 RepID=A0ABT3AW21_9CYAN|nr:formyltransferase family protein [Plectonema radiosum]MCV3213332.1 formyltransferase family protein [Plectonema radiosum NIES-515]